MSTPAPGTATASRTGSRLLTELRAEIAHADNKASVLLGALSMTAGLLGALLAARQWAPGRLSAPGAVLWWTGVMALAGSLLALLLAIVPRYGRERWAPGRPLTYFDDIRRAADQQGLARALADTEAAADTGLLDALSATSRIVGSKHLWIRAGLAAYCVGAVLVPSALILG
ncbi:Pycsar system effector family protein [Streptomyces polygonati]|uniref:Pycsar system effector family protein n=1 Tax=Streptomyces polygonati TaxID=1617087 RepID=A0ABV8HLT5_9ACTN